MTDDYIVATADKYFTKSRQVAEQNGDKNVTYGVFMRRPVMAALDPAVIFLMEHAPGVKIHRAYADGILVDPEKPLLVYNGSYAVLGELETRLLQLIGLPCVTAYNAYQQCLSLRSAQFLDMHARHAFDSDMTHLAAYGASVGSKMAQLQGAKGFIGSSLDATARFYGAKGGLGTMPHALIGYAGSTLDAAKLYYKTHPRETTYTVLVDYFGREVTDAMDVSQYFRSVDLRCAVRLDTHGGRFMQGLDYEKSVSIVSSHPMFENGTSEYDIVRRVMGEAQFDADTTNVQKDRYRRHLFGKGVSVAAVIHMRRELNRADFEDTLIVASSGFDPFKCRVFGAANAPVDVVGTGSFLPETMGETYATADIFEYDGVFSVKVGRESIFRMSRGLFA